MRLRVPTQVDSGQEVYALVGHLEGLAARIAAGLPAARRRELVERLRTVNGQLAAHASAQGDAAHFFDLDTEFHRTYVEGVVGLRLLALHRAIKPQSDRYSRLYVSVFVNQVTTSVREHEAITDTIACGDRDGAQRATENNWYNASERLARVIEQHGERGNWEAWGGQPIAAELIGASPRSVRTRKKASVP